MEMPTIDMKNMIELPLDADGMPIRVGDRVTVTDVANTSQSLEVMRLELLGERNWMICCHDTEDGGTAVWQPSYLVHEDTLQAIKKDIWDLVVLKQQEAEEDINKIMERIKKAVER